MKTVETEIFENFKDIALNMKPFGLFTVRKAAIYDNSLYQKPGSVTGTCSEGR